MAYDAVGLMGNGPGGSVGAGAGSTKQVWHYATNDNAAAVEGAGYFNDAPLTKGDVILASLDLDGTPALKAYVCASGDGESGSAKTITGLTTI